MTSSAGCPVHHLAHDCLAAGLARQQHPTPVCQLEGCLEQVVGRISLLTASLLAQRVPRGRTTRFETPRELMS
jgi:hypothetical protein